MDRMRFVEHLGKRILLVDYSAMADPAEVVDLIQRSGALIQSSPPKSVRVVMKVNDARFTPHVINTLKDTAAKNEPHILAVSVVGLSGVMTVIHRSIARLIGLNVPPFSTMEEAMDWLASQP